MENIIVAWKNKSDNVDQQLERLLMTKIRCLITIARIQGNNINEPGLTSALENFIRLVIGKHCKEV